MQLFKCNRMIPNTKHEVSFDVEADDGAEAKVLAQEIAYALAFRVGGGYPDKDHKVPPEDWAVLEAAKIELPDRLIKVKEAKLKAAA